jgi:hypothetical protein
VARTTVRDVQRGLAGRDIATPCVTRLDADNPVAAAQSTRRWPSSSRQQRVEHVARPIGVGKQFSVRLFVQRDAQLAQTTPPQPAREMLGESGG